MVPIYNITGLKWKDENKTGVPTLILDRPSIANIFRGTITNWSDPSIVATNPGIFFLDDIFNVIIDAILPNEPISIVIRNDISGFTYIFSKHLERFVSDWQYPTGYQWAPEILNLSNAIKTIENYGVLSEIVNNNNSIGYITKPQYQVMRGKSRFV